MINVESKDFANLQRGVGKLDKEVQKAIKARLRKAIKPVVAEVKAEALLLPSGRGKSPIRSKAGQRPSLRVSLSRAVIGELVTTKRGAGAHVRVKKSRFMAISGRDNPNLPWYVEGRPGKRNPRIKGSAQRGWKHPVFGHNMDHPETWPTQSATPFLDATVKKHKEAYAEEVNAAFLDAMEKLDIHFKAADKGKIHFR